MKDGRTHAVFTRLQWYGRTACFSCWMCYDICCDMKGDWMRADGQMDRELIIACRSFANAPDNTARDGSILIDECNACL